MSPPMFDMYDLKYDIDEHTDEGKKLLEQNMSFLNQSRSKMSGYHENFDAGVDDVFGDNDDFDNNDETERNTFLNSYHNFDDNYDGNQMSAVGNQQKTGSKFGMYKNKDGCDHLSFRTFCEWLDLD